MSFGPFLSAVDAGLGRAGFQQEPIASEFAAREGERGVLLTSHAWHHPLGAIGRCALLNGPRASILNVLVYPRNAAAVPVFAAEYVAFGPRPVVAVVDLQAVDPTGPLRAEVERLMQLQATEFGRRVTGGGELPEWARTHFTATAIYSRPAGAEEMPAHLEAFAAYLESWRRGWFEPHESASATDAPALSDYQRHHVEHTPGRPFLAKTFGEEWTEFYLRDFMYPADVPAPAPR